MGWSDWKAIEEPAGYEGSAVYKVRLTWANGPASIPRFLDVDTDGLLCIGETEDFDRRRRRLVRGLRKGRGHSEGNLLHIVERYSSLGKVYPGCTYEYSFLRVDSKETATATEERLIKEYVRRFGEPPPLNSNIPGRYGAEGW
jgi:hypothetical protein